MTKMRIAFVVFVFLSFLRLDPSNAQMQIHSSVPMRGVGSGFFERTGIAWGFRQSNPGGYVFFNNGGPGPIPPFGGFDPNSQASFGFGGRSGDLSWNFGIVAGQGSSQSIVSQSPGIMLPNGGTGVFWNMFQQPFVTGIVPVVGARSVSPLQERIARLQYQRLIDQGTVERRTERRREADSVTPDPPSPRHDDPPLILGRE